MAVSNQRRQTEEPRRRALSGVILAAIIIGIAGLLWAITPVSCMSPRAASQRKHCFNYMRLIKSIVESVATAHGIREGQQIPEKLLIQYCPHNRFPECPGGGIYKVPLVGGTVKCSLHGEPI